MTIFSVAMVVCLLLIQPLQSTGGQLSINQTDRYFSGITHIGAEEGFQETTAQIMARHVEKTQAQEPRMMLPARISIDREHYPQNPHAPAIANYPFLRKASQLEAYEQLPDRDPQTLSLNFTGATLTELNLFPPDSMGAIGPQQFIIAINGLVRTFNKKTGVADGVLNVDTDVFFSSISNGGFTSDPRIRYDRFSGRWFIIMISIPNNFDNNRIMIAVSNSRVISASTIWSFFYFTAGLGNFLDYPTLGVDVNALYIGGQTFPGGNAPEEEETRAEENTGQVFVVRKSSILGSGPIVVTVFNNVIDPITGIGPYVPQGVDNFDSNATVGYFIGVDNASFGRLILRRVSDPGGIPTLSSDIPVTVPMTQFPIRVPHLGNNNGQAGNLDAIDDRLYMAHIRNGNLWTAHNIGVDNNGISSNSVTLTRNGSRWYQINVTPTTPELIQSGTLFASSPANTLDQRFYWIPSLMTSGQGHMALGCSIAGSTEHINVATAGRLASDPLGTLQSVTQCTNSSFAYNPPGNPGNEDRGRRWGDYSYTTLDPSDNMTMWTIQEFCNATNSWGVRVTKLLAPPPARPISASPSTIPRGMKSVKVTITASSTEGSGFYDPGVGFTSRIKAMVSGRVRVKGVKYLSPTSVRLNISTVKASLGQKNVTIINPDKQQITANGLIRIT